MTGLTELPNKGDRVVITRGWNAGRTGEFGGAGRGIRGDSRLCCVYPDDLHCIAMLAPVTDVKIIERTGLKIEKDGESYRVVGNDFRSKPYKTLAAARRQRSVFIRKRAWDRVTSPQ